MDHGSDDQHVDLKDNLHDILEVALEIETNQDAAPSSSGIQHQRSLSTETTVSELGIQYSKQDDTPFIEAFFNRWSSLAKQGFQLDSPTQIYNDIENDPNLTHYLSKFVNARLKLDSLNPQLPFSILQSFIIRRCINEFRNFDCVAAGAVYYKHEYNGIEASNHMSSMGGTVKYAENINSAAYTFQGLNVSLRAVANKISSVSNKLKIIELQTATSLPIMGYSCEPYFLIANENGVVDEKETKALYPEMTPLDEKLLNILSSCKATTVCCYISLNWEQLVELIPSDSTLSWDNLLIAFENNFIVRYPNPVQGQLHTYCPTNIPA